MRSSIWKYIWSSLLYFCLFWPFRDILPSFWVIKTTFFSRLYHRLSRQFLRRLDSKEWFSFVVLLKDLGNGYSVLAWRLASFPLLSAWWLSYLFAPFLSHICRAQFQSDVSNQEVMIICYIGCSACLDILQSAYHLFVMRILSLWLYI